MAFTALFHPYQHFLCLAITFCVIGQACTNTRLLSALEDRYAYECIHNDEEILRKLSETKQLLSKRQLRIYVVQCFDEQLFTNLKEDENNYIISAELVLTCADKKIVRRRWHARTRTALFHFLGHSGTTKKSTFVFPTSVVSCDLFCWWDSAWDSCRYSSRRECSTPCLPSLMIWTWTCRSLF